MAAVTTNAQLCVLKKKEHFFTEIYKKMYMKETQVTIKATGWIKPIITAATLGFVFILNNATAQTFAGAPEPADTIRMISGVPLKAEDVSPLLNGENIPQVKLIDANGKAFDLNAAVALKPTILVFYRGGWCPYCSKQLSGLQEIQQELTTMGYQVLAISTDSPDNLKKAGDKQSLTYTLLSDADLTVSKKFGIAYKSPKNYDSFLPETSGGKNVDKLVPVPSVFILNRKGNIRFEYINPNITQRINPALLKAAAAALYAEL